MDGESPHSFWDQLQKLNHGATAIAIIVGGIAGTDLEQRITKVEDRTDAIVAVATDAAHSQIQIVANQDRDTERIAVLEADIKRLEGEIAGHLDRDAEERTNRSGSEATLRGDLEKLRDRLGQLEVIIGALKERPTR